MPEATDQRIEAALHALLSSDAAALHAALAADPDIINLRWQGHTLLEWANQPSHIEDPTVIAVLVDAGAALDRALGLTGCWNKPAMATQLLQAGADPTSLFDDDSPITPLESAAMHSSTDVADVLVLHGLHRETLWLAAASGLTDRVASWLNTDGSLTRGPGPYRPNWSHVGRPEASPAPDDDATVTAEAFTFAAANNRLEVVDLLLSRGAAIDAAPYRGITGLHFAVQFGRLSMVEALLERGASRQSLDDEWSATPARWAEECVDDSTERKAILALLS